MVGFFDFLTARARAVNSLLCVGLDPRASHVKELRTECARIIEATAEYAAAFKPNSAFFEMHGPEGMAALLDVIASIPDGIPVILDAKRGDIADTAEAYARAVFDALGAHALTVSPYLGGETIAPFIARPDRGVFILCKTSNPGADEFQSLPILPSPAERGPEVEGERSTLFELIAQRAQEWNTRGNVGLVVGATYPEALARARAHAPDLWFLVPGVGAQGGDLERTLTAGLRPDGLGLLINVSRALARAANPGEAARKWKDEINQGREVKVQRGKAAIRPAPALFRSLAQDLLASGCARFGQFTLKSGILSPIYLDLRRLVTYPEILRRVAQAYAEKLSALKFDRLAGIPYAGLPIATAIALEMNRPLLYPRREAKNYGTQASVEGDFRPGETVAVIDDLATTGDTKIESIQKLEAAGLIVRDIVVLIDREQGAREALAQAGYRLHAVVTLRALLDEWRRAGAISAEQFDEVRTFLTR
ncbi:MAG: orotidine-5'-phosphate decarboxylase [Anaerolineales bacterium]